MTELANQRALYAYSNNVLTEPKQSHKISTYAYPYVVAALTFQRTSFLELMVASHVSAARKRRRAIKEEGSGVKFFLTPFFAVRH